MKKQIYNSEKFNVHRCFSIFCLSFLIIFYGTEWNGIETLIYIFGINNDVHRCFSIISLICLIIFYGMERNRMEKVIDIFGIKTMFTGVSQSFA
jgi:hypothetical protein